MRGYQTHSLYIRLTLCVTVPRGSFCGIHRKSYFGTSFAHQSEDVIQTKYPKIDANKYGILMPNSFQDDADTG
jgi:hypothetical protein